MAKTISRCTTVTTAPEVVFEHLADYRWCSQLLEGLVSFSPLGSQTTGEGALFEAVVDMGFRGMHAKVALARLVQPQTVTWEVLGGTRATVSFDLAQQQDRTTVSLSVTYDEPRGIRGAVVAPFVEHSIERQVIGAIEQLRRRLAPAP